MTEEEAQTSALAAACAKEVSAQILHYADQAGQDRLSFLLNVAALLAASALAAQPEARLQSASAHLQNALGLIHCLRNDE